MRGGEGRVCNHDLLGDTLDWCHKKGIDVHFTTLRIFTTCDL